ncbi:MAG: hypothetical protein H8E31_02905, partial [Planctomycetes bacterium]|nr:hypothetical protein [Planctomycetota bacterium]
APGLLPAPAACAGGQVAGGQPARLPRFGELGVPAGRREAGGLQLGVEILDGDPALGELEVAALPPARLGPPRLLASGPSAAGARVEVELEISAPAAEGALLRLRWRQAGGVAERSLRLAGPGRFSVWGQPWPEWAAGGSAFEPAGSPADARILFAGAGTPAQAVESALERGALVVADQADLPASLRPLRPALAPAGGVLFLIDVSGSMEGGPYAEALARIAAWAALLPPELPIQVRPFAAELGAPGDPRRPEEWAALQRVLPFGPTALAAAVDQAAGQSQAGAHLVLVSDGQAEAPAGGWRPLGERLAEVFASVRCVPVGPRGDHPSLAGLGELAPLEPGADLSQRLERALSELPGTFTGPLHAVAGAAWSLPSSLDPARPLPRLETRPGAEALMRNAGGSDGAALLRAGAGTVLGLAGGASDPAWAPLILSVATELERPRLERTGSWIQLAADGAGWTARSAGLGQVGFDRLTPDLWRAGPFRAGEAVEVQPPSGPSWSFAGTPEAELSASSEEWSGWLDTQRRLPAPDASRPVLLGAALVCAVLALGASGRRRRLLAAGGNQDS